MKNEISVQSFDSRRVKSRVQVWKVIGLTLLCCGSLYGQRITSFDAPGAGNAPFSGQGTFPTAITPGGVIAGYVLDANNVYHGFIRDHHGSFTTIDVPGASNTPNAYPTEGTQVTSINPGGTIVGYYTTIDKSPFGFYYTATHNFLRTPDGTITNIDPPNFYRSNSGSPAAGGPVVINDLGIVTGNYTSSKNFGTHGFLYTPGATPPFTSFDPPSSSETIPTGINSSGQINGFCDNGNLGFLRNPDNTYVLFASSPNTYTTGINNRGDIIGSVEYNIYYGPPYGFLRTAAGTIQGGGLNSNVFPGYGANIFPYAINPRGTITGNYFNFALGQYSGFELRGNNFTSFDPTGSTNTTAPSAINPAGDITGSWYDSNFVAHGFLRVH